MARIVDGTKLYQDAIKTIDDLRERIKLLEAAFTAYVTDGLEESATKNHEKQSPPVLGFCVTCGFPVYESDWHGGGRFHYTGGRYQSGPLVCGFAKLPTPKRTHMDYCGLADDHEGQCSAVVTRMLGA